jgi:hypothetical protein
MQALMQDYFIFDEAELTRIDIVCPKCGTVAVYELSKDQTAIAGRDCPMR